MIATMMVNKTQATIPCERARKTVSKTGVKSYFSLGSVNNKQNKYGGMLGAYREVEHSRPLCTEHPPT